MKIAIGADDAATELKELVKKHLEERGLEVGDFSHDMAEPRLIYPDIAFNLATAIREGKFARGILLCGTGIGMAIVANKVAGIRAAQCHDSYSAERARKSNNAQIMTLGARVIGHQLALTIIDTWLAAEYEIGRSTRNVERIDYYDAMTHSASQDDK
ncbi:ribose 5-phosphate isomerase B [Enterobacteriaceae bacterium H11S18]|uniref:ribose 5-phosphate isomerase B n=1 Tax=Enterobacteriaceae TaxID=543 RepID=UPI0019252344|nr:MULTISPECIES: ribose 5-phosphate isomerase B [Enterobacteriaceae]MCT4712205.1 ribose 5-phosphate isomerase B [Dryocola clanedunensis]